MLEELSGIPKRIAALKSKLAARENKKEYAENCDAIRAEIQKLEAVTVRREALASGNGEEVSK